MGRRDEHICPKFKLWISSPEAEGIFGDGKWRLLDAVNKDRSLSAAAQTLKISYRKAWGDLKKAEEYFGESLVEKHRGGAGGGEATLTDTGKAWLKAYSKFRSDVEQNIMQAFTSHIAPLLHRKEKK